MFYLIASIISSSMIYVIFRIAKNYSCKLTSLITLNYLAATILGIFLFNPLKGDISNITLNWLPYSILLGILFIAMFYLIGNSSQKAGVSVTTLANKLSLVFPVLFSLLYFNEKITALKIVGLVTALIAIILTVYKKDLKKTNLLFIFLPVLIFFGSGITDSVVKYVQAVKIETSETSIFSSLVFFVAFILGSLISIVKKDKISFTHSPTLILGVLLGATNFGSLYFILNALNKSNMNSSMVFSINNMSIVALSAVIGTSIFHEKLNKINVAGILLAIISLYLLL